jgi:NAD(P)-dependent dehydrogenase (short-subunit alcohol dehydrogenase family)
MTVRLEKELKMDQIVLITGCSTGIGRDLARQLTRAGYTVAATARDVNSLANLPAALKLPLDVTRPDSIRDAVGQVIQRFGRIDVLVNNAGYAIRGAVEEVPIEQAQQMFDVNLFGVMRMIQAVLPQMRRQKAGRIINISSVVGKLVTPANGTYSSTKFALEGLSDALRLELAPFGIQVVLVEPGSIKTPFHDTMEANAQKIFTNPASPYRALYAQFQKVTVNMRKQEAGPEAVSRVIQQAIEVSRPKARYVAGFPFSGRLVLQLGGSGWDMVVRQLFNIKQKEYLFNEQ